MLKYFKHTMSLVLPSLSLISMFCITSTAANAATLNIGVGGELTSFDTSQVQGGIWESQILQDVYEGLLQNSAEGTPIPGVASHWKISDDGRTYTFYLRPDAKWSDGTPVTADDFVFGWQQVLNPKSASDYAYMLYPVVNAKAINSGKKPVSALGVKSLDNGRVFQVTLNRPTSYFLHMMTHFTAYPQPKKVVEKYGANWVQMNHIVTDGAYKPVQWILHDHIEVVKNPYYHDASKVAINTVNYYNAEDINSAVIRYRAGEFDITSVPPTLYNVLKSKYADALHQSPYLGAEYYAFNNRPGHPTSDKRVREALTLAVRRDVLAKAIMEGAFLPSESLVPPDMKGYTPQTADDRNAPYPQRLAKAKQLLAEAGYSPSHPLTLTLSYNTNDQWRRVAVAVAAMWRPLGVNVRMNNSEASVHFASLRQGKFDVGRASWIADYNDPEDFLSILQSGVAKNYEGYASPTFDHLMSEADATTDETKRIQLMEQAERVAMNDYALLPLFTYVSQYLVNPKIHGWKTNVLNTHPARWMSF